MIKQAKAIYDLKDQAIEKLKAKEQYELYKDVEMPVSRILTEMEFQGAKIDLTVLKQLEPDFSKQIDVLQRDIYLLAHKEFNISSPKQLGEVL